ncbi:sulfite reductase flavoprotein subunit alpha [Sinimarinibacterium sp. NLF-5-8]|uniref:diflavin oxidoreductase n=1 Tax=Sinimarinibacterium sp. NLF-5-8 TaxID=2698684 RepID=UPI00192EF7DC|nr:flavodoxin domain-containing protein [Sinimarinibacterium sp. NLF-5-8]
MTMTTDAPLTSRPFTERQWQDLQPLLKQLDHYQCFWLSGYLAGRIANIGTPPSEPPADAAPSVKVVVAYGTETGNSKTLAQRCAAQATALGIAAEVVDLASLKVRQLTKQSHLLLITSTHGDGEPPEPIQTFYNALLDARAPKLPELQYRVLALGDSSYEKFCETGRQLDERLAALGARRLAERVECDVDFAVPAEAWITQTLALLPVAVQSTAAPSLGANLGPNLSDLLPATEAAEKISKNNPVSLEVLDNVRLSLPTREQSIHHIELALEQDLGLVPGDAVGVLVDNPQSLVDAVLSAARLSADAPVTLDGHTLPLAQVLRERRDLTIPGARLLELWAAQSGNPTLQQTSTDRAAQKTFLREHQVLDVLIRYPAQIEPQALVDALRPLPPRLYDVANDPADDSGELHLTVARYQYAFGDRLEHGIASHALAALEAGDQLKLYPHRHARFHLPEDDAAPLVLIADSTGIAPYRAFIQSLARAEKPRQVWLLLAEQNFEHDFLYQVEWQQALTHGTLTRLDTVFSVQDGARTLAEPLTSDTSPLLQWLQQGAHVYLCGDTARLTVCDEALENWYNARRAEAPTWAELGKAKRIHRNLY